MNKVSLLRILCVRPPHVREFTVSQHTMIPPGECDGSYFRLGEVEHFLLSQLDGQQSARSIRKSYEQRFGNDSCRSIIHRGWDQHYDPPSDLRLQCGDVDRACVALVLGLKHRGLLDETLIVWGGEFGRTVYCQLFHNCLNRR